MSEATSEIADAGVYEPCSVVVTATACTVTLRVSGELDDAGWSSLERALLSCLVVEADEIVVDLTDVEFVSVSACRDLHRAIGTLRTARRRVDVLPCRPLARVVHLLTRLGNLPAGAASFLPG